MTATTQHKLPILVLASLFSVSAAAENWVDVQHQKAEQSINNAAMKIDKWIGDSDLNQSATASIRLMLDNQWNRYDGYSIKPRIRAKIKLPALKKRLSLVMGDEELDNRATDKTHIAPNYTNLEKGNYYDRHQARNDNAALALRWSGLGESLGVETDFDVGLRSGGDVYGRFKAKKTWQFSAQTSAQVEQIYRYGSKSRHYLRTHFEPRYTFNPQRFVANLTYIEYLHRTDEALYWGNSLYQQHLFVHNKKLTYGLFTGGRIKHKQPSLNSYGPFISWRQPILREWIFYQAELNYYNDKERARKHNVGAFLRLETIF